MNDAAVAVVAVVLAAGKGTRMRSDLPKVLHALRGRPLVLHVLGAARGAGVERAVAVVGYGAPAVRAAINAGAPPGLELRYALQSEQRGTGHAVLCALPELVDHHGPVLILSGDVPGIRSRTLLALIAACDHSPAGLAFITFDADDPTGYGRIVRDAEGRPERVVEHRDATPEQRAITEVNAGVYCVDAGVLRHRLGAVRDDNEAGELYLTDLVELAASRGSVATLSVDAHEVAGVNTPEQLEALELDPN